jgi:hypothetical protein
MILYLLIIGASTQSSSNRDGVDAQKMGEIHEPVGWMEIPMKNDAAIWQKREKFQWIRLLR